MKLAGKTYLCCEVYTLVKTHFSLSSGLYTISSVISFAICPSLCCASMHQSMIVQNIEIVGLKHISHQTVLSYMKVKKGDRLSAQQSKQIIKRLYATQFFRDVRMSVKKGCLRVYIQEQPIISSLDISGVKTLNKKIILDSLKKMDLAPGRFFSQARLKRVEMEIRKFYHAKGFYDVQVKVNISQSRNNRLDIQIKVIEGKLAKVRKIVFIGNSSISTYTLRSEMRLSTQNWFSWYSKNHLYSREKFDLDLDAVKNCYRNRGFYNFKFDAHEANISADKKSVYLTLSISEGKPYHFSDVLLSGELLGKSEEFKKLIKIKKGDLFSASKLSQSEKLIKEKLAEYGFAFPTVDVLLKEDDVKQLISVHFNIQTGKRLYVRNINVSGNSTTRDDVIRREIRQFENAWYDGGKLSLSKDRLNRLGYFDGVDIAPLRVKGVDDQIDIEVRVAEAKTGSGNLSFGYSSTDRLVMGLSFSKDNIFGTGNNLSASFNNARASRSFEFSHYDPYFTIDNISKSTNLFYRTTQPLLYASNDKDYRVLNFGGDLQFGVPFSEIDKVFFGIGCSRYVINISDKTPLFYSSYVSKVGNISNVIPLTIAWTRDVRDNAISPSRGYLSSVNFEFGVPLGTPYYKVDLRQKYYYSFGRGFTLGVNGVVGYGSAYNGRHYPIFKNYYAGGIGSVRGYSTHSLGPRDPSGNDSLGGSKLLLGNVELMLPIPGSGYDRSLRIFTFLDAGNVWGASEKIYLSSLRFGYGVGLAWMSPVGPLSISYGLPLIKHQGDRYDRFQFNIGTSF